MPAPSSSPPHSHRPRRICRRLGTAAPNPTPGVHWPLCRSPAMSTHQICASARPLDCPSPSSSTASTWPGCQRPCPFQCIQCPTAACRCSIALHLLLAARQLGARPRV